LLCRERVGEEAQEVAWVKDEVAMLELLRLEMAVVGEKALLSFW
jgi:hypothetical protein